MIYKYYILSKIILRIVYISNVCNIIINCLKFDIINKFKSSQNFKVIYIKKINDIIWIINYKTDWFDQGFITNIIIFKEFVSF